MVKETESEEGVESSMRVTLKSTRAAAWFSAISGVALPFGMLIKGEYQLVPVSSSLVLGGFAVLLGVTWAKAIQAKFEGVGPV